LENLLNSSYKEFYRVFYRYCWNKLGKKHEYAIPFMKKDTYGSCRAGVFSAEST